MDIKLITGDTRLDYRTSAAKDLVERINRVTPTKLKKFNEGEFDLDGRLMTLRIRDLNTLFEINPN